MVALVTLTVVLPSAAAGAVTPTTPSTDVPGSTETLPDEEGPAPTPAEGSEPIDDDAAPEAAPEGVTVPSTVPPAPDAGPEAGAPPAPAAPPVDLARVRRLVASQLRLAVVDLARLEEALAAAEARFTAADTLRIGAERALGAAKVEEGRAVRRLRVARLDMQERATAAFIRGTFSDLSSVLDSQDPNDFLRRTEFMGSALQADHDAIDEYKAAKGLVDERLTRVADRIATTTLERDAARRDADALGPELEVARRRVAMHEAGSAISVAGFVFPVGNPHSFVDSFLAPRMTGTGFEHRHQGTDIMAASGTPLFACERGVIAKVGTDRLGGTKLWLVGESGTRYYYAHLSAYAEGVAEGLAVPAGQVVGFVGATGNASGGPAHLHFEVHPAGSEAVNPFPLLTVTDTAG